MYNALCVLFCSQPWDRDNVKLFYIWLFVASGFNAVTLLRPFMAAFGDRGQQASRDKPSSDSAKASLFIVPTLLFLMMTTGFLSYVREAGNNHILYGRDEIAVRSSDCLVSFCCCWAASQLACKAEAGAMCSLSHHVSFDLNSILLRYLVSKRLDAFHFVTIAVCVQVGQWLRQNTRTEAVVLTTDTHRSPAGYVAGRPSLVAFTGALRPHSCPRLSDLACTLSRSITATRLW